MPTESPPIQKAQRLEMGFQPGERLRLVQFTFRHQRLHGGLEIQPDTSRPLTHAKRAMLLFLVSAKARQLAKAPSLPRFDWVGRAGSPAACLAQALKKYDQPWLCDWFGRALHDRRKQPFEMCRGLFRFVVPKKQSAEAEYRVSLSRDGDPDPPSTVEWVELDPAAISVFLTGTKEELGLGELESLRKQLYVDGNYNKMDAW
jgi:hypothetical protein